MHPIIARAKAESRNLLEPEAKQLFADCGLPVQPFKVACSEREAVEAARSMGYPSVLKIVSRDISHKSDVGGVRVNLKNDDEVATAYREMLESVRNEAPNAKVEGVLVAPFAPAGLECIVGMTRDAQFGPALAFGIGGIFVEIMKDVSFRVLPIDSNDAEEMVKEIKGFPLLAGTRGEKRRDVGAVVDFLARAARLIEANPEIMEMDINPLMVYETGVLALDARVIL